MQNKQRLIVLITAAAAAAVLIIALIVLNLRVSSLSKAIEAQKTLLIEESTDYRENDDYIDQFARMLALDINQTRASLGLPVTEYPDRNEDGQEAALTGDEDSVFYDSITVLMKAERDNAKSAAIGEFLKSDLIEAYLAENELTEIKNSDTETLINFGDYLLLSVGAGSGTDIVLTNFSGKNLNTRKASKEAVFFIDASLGTLKENIAEKERMAEDLKILANSDRVFELCGDDIKVKLEDDYTLNFSNRFNANTIRVRLEGLSEPVFSLSGSSTEYKETGSLGKDLEVRLEQLDLRTSEEVLIDTSKMKVENLIASDEFNAYLASLELLISSDAREDNDYIYYDINHKDGSRLGSFSILKKLGDIYLVDADEVPVSSLKTISIKKELAVPSANKMIIPENIPSINNLYSNEDSITFLLVGAHELNTDTMIIVHADKSTGKAFMIGIPRDLYWKGRKINSIYQYFGPEQFKKELSEITGLNITNYVSVDMYAFIDIINILGGIEVTLKEDLIDPTYRTRENGEWSTLNYPKGTYRLNGVEALRIARSRHGSNDFDRSERQQLIIEAFLNRFLEFNITDVNKVYSLIQAMYEYVDTDFSLFDMMSVYNNYGNSQLAGKHVLSFDNILYDTYSNIYLLEDKDVELPPDYNKGAWILFPRDNDWNNIRWYIRKIINGE